MKKAEKKLKLDAKILAYTALISGALPFIKTPTSDAQIVYSGLKLTRVHANARDSNSTFIDIDGDGTPDFKFQFYHRGLIPFFISEIKMYGIDGISSKNIHGIGSNVIARTQEGFNLSNDLLIPDAVQSWARSTVLNGKQGVGVACAAGYCFGYWGGLLGSFTNNTGFLGIKFKQDSNVHYGWVRYRGVPGWIGRTRGVIIDWAYEDTPDTAIETGQIE